MKIEDLLISQGVKESIAISYGRAYDSIVKRYKLDTDKRLAAFFANVLIESMKLNRVTENLNYSALQLSKVWPHRYGQNGRRGVPNFLANKIARNPQLVANHTYGSRMGNGPPSSGDGWKYRGRGPIQVTGKDNYKLLERECGIDCVNNPDMLLDPNYGALSSALFWYRNNINKFADKGDFDGCRDMVNRGKKTIQIGDSLGYEEGLKYYKSILNYFNKIGFTSL